MKKNVAFTILYLASIILVVLFFTVFYHKKPDLPTSAISEKQTEPQNQLLSETDILLNKLSLLQKADEQYASLLTQSGFNASMDSVDTRISIEETSFKNVIDSFIQNENPENNEIFKKMNEYFNQTLENRRAMGNIRYALAAGNFDLDSNQKKWLRMNSDLITKNKRIKQLEDLIQANSGKTNNQNNGLNAQIASLTATTNKQQTENENLKQNIKSLNALIATLQTNLALNESSPAKQPQQTSTADLEKIQQLKDEIQLAKISCNLTRADARQIISSSKERRDLLTDALRVLTNLSRSNDPEIREEANTKLKELQRIAGTIRN